MLDLALLCTACTAGDLLAVLSLLEHGVSPQSNPDAYRSCIPLFCAAESGSAACVQLLLDAGVNPNALDSNNSTALFYAGSAEVVRTLLSAGTHRDHINRWEQDALDELLVNAFNPQYCNLGHCAAAQALLDAGVPLERLTSNGWSRVHHVAFDQRADAADWLLKRGASLHTDTEGSTPLHKICWQRDSSKELNFATEQLIRYFTAAGINIESRDNQGKTPLHLAVGGDAASLIAIRTLLELGAEVDACDAEGRTPLHYIAEDCVHGRTDCIQLLLAAGADPQHAGKDGITPLALAEQLMEVYEGYSEEDEPLRHSAETPEECRARNARLLLHAQKAVALLANSTHTTITLSRPP